MREIKPLKYKDLEGLSEKQLKEHHDVLYAGYVKKIGEIEEKLKSVDLSSANATYSDLRELKMEETFALNGVKLHEGYFDNMAKGGVNPAGRVKEMIARDFGSYEAWEKEFRALGLTARGWVVLCYDLDEKKLKNIICDSHNQGGVWNSIALLIMDVYEHAYFIDYATGRKAYIDAFFKNIDWQHTDKLMSKFGDIFLEG
ncbi:superoxide dismutase [Candidatus Giovannonibacteria bacterium RIFCSPLOWO2_02_FULL_45_14]|uniref:superoxide dismutase n=1 Tax=Candidatus Giovannonibacteria bacterium RIFCSPLOWO2_12_FULL_44_15 TaxID=1798364 RepID=A0A1F5XZY9_9BACT|nr:MAG: superoxide dismutase [Candidatus Giovannonibacteria bacterium RIFCSPHIGHO2_02_FULL_44_31]OGF75893.1 MAG: superoxide dismutase [Candidatus Giovannonibacteria bacterium RIFCSPHIGHO2_12_FULL_44_29]OGF91207.1 MAG: superoxide dismutase [Candidatus Giovannonibacteria bacterium RIFCSPLOWO2_02_FULL_45_14]OGF93507.1 MAG: superoxide dismutase [Candidatus Giovannonibacteria bacterium RIFCSPLOWO2_12_FULL_44_15]